MMPRLMVGLVCALPSLLWASCDLTVNHLSFSGYDVFQPQHNDSVGQLQVYCDEAQPYTVKLSTGQGSYARRELGSARYRLGYNVYTQANYATVWGDGSANSTVHSGNHIGQQRYYIYGRIFARQNVGIGSYQDTLIVTLEY